MRRMAKSFYLTLGITVIISFGAAFKNTNLSLAANNNSSPIIADLPNTADGKIFQQIINYGAANQLERQPIGTIVQNVAQQLLNSEYQAGLLDRSTEETLVISLKQFDCLLFVENVLAIANNIATQNHSYQAYTKEVENQRYWNGTMNGYCSRLHYFSDWIADNQRRGKVTNITPSLGGVNKIKKLNFMTTHRHSYKNLAKNDATFKCIQEVEESLTENFNYIPTQNIRQVYPQLQPGDIVGVATNIAGLDFTHTGFAYRQPNGRIGLIHASPAGKVVIARDLQNYIGNVKNAIGIVVTRASEPNLR